MIARYQTDPDSPNRKIDKAINALMKEVESLPPDVAVKIIATAINWEKVKAKITEADSDFDPGNL